MTRPFVSLLTDFGLRDPSAAICRGVIAGIAPDATVLDISHEVRKFSIRDGALLLWCALPYLPVGIHVAVVDPGVGTARRPVAVRTGRGDVLIGPDNGLLPAGAARIGGPIEARELANPAYRLPTVSTSFHGRDIFSPAAAHLALGVALADLGPAVDVDSLVPSALPDAIVRPGALESSIVYVDTFGNVKLAGLVTDLVEALGPFVEGDRIAVQLGQGGEARTEVVPWATTFGSVPVGTGLLYEDSYGRICLADNQGNAAARLGLAPELPLVVRRA